VSSASRAAFDAIDLFSPPSDASASGPFLMGAFLPDLSEGGGPTGFFASNACPASPGGFVVPGVGVLKSPAEPFGGIACGSPPSILVPPVGPAAPGPRSGGVAGDAFLRLRGGGVSS